MMNEAPQNQDAADTQHDIAPATLFFSASRLAFYDAAIWSHELPSDAIEIDRARHADILEELSEGMVLTADEEGRPAVAPPPPPTTDQLAASVRRDRDARIADIQWMVERHTSQLALETATTLSHADYLELLQYLQDLRDVPLQAEFPQSVTWPIPPAFVSSAQ